MVYFNSTTYNLIFITLIIMLLLGDLGQFFLAGTHSIPLLFCLYCSLIYCSMQYAIITIVVALQCLEFFCFYNSFSLVFLYLIPTTISAFLFKKYLYPSHTHAIALALIGTIIQIYAIEGYFLHIWQTSYYYTIVKIVVILFIVISFSLIINIWGMQDNRA